MIATLTGMFRMTSQMPTSSNQAQGTLFLTETSNVRFSQVGNETIVKLQSNVMTFQPNHSFHHGQIGATTPGKTSVA